MQKAIAVAAKVYKEYNTPAMLGQLSDYKLKVVGIDDKDDRKLVMGAIRKARLKGSLRKQKKESSSTLVSPIAGPSAVQNIITPPKRKRKRTSTDHNEFFLDSQADEAANLGSLEFNEILDEDVLRIKSTVVNRAPIMTAWATLVAERMHFKREEALSIASVYTEINAISKGISLGIYDKGKGKCLEVPTEGSQPYVELMGRRVPLYHTQSGEWRALSNGSPVPPSTAFSYISRSFRQTTASIVGALRLLSESYEPQELNSKAWSLYMEFRPSVDKWGERSDVSCAKILDLRKKGKLLASDKAVNEPSGAGMRNESVIEPPEGHADGPRRKRPRELTLEEYEVALDQDSTFDNVDLSFNTTIP